MERRLAAHTYLLIIVSLLVALVTANALSPAEVQKYKQTFDLIYNIVKGPLKHEAYEQTALFTDTFGPRIYGSSNLEESIQWLKMQMVMDRFENVHLERVDNGVHWVRGSESLEMLEPRYQNMGVTALGLSVAAPAQGITAEALVVSSFDELEAKKNLVPGKIVVYNEVYANYSFTNQYRSNGAKMAEKYGAVASLVRSITPFSLYSVHTGAMNNASIPAGAITVEDALMLSRIQERGHTIKLKLNLQSEFKEPASSYNVVGEIVGSQYPQEVVIISAHIDSWDITNGALDDAGGVMTCYQALRAIIKLGLRPKRTIRFVAWTGEEIGMLGVRSYVQAHSQDLNNILLAYETDNGVTTPQGMGFAGGANGLAIISQIVTTLLPPLNATRVEKKSLVGSDIIFLEFKGVPGLEPLVDDSRYFWYHHSRGDSMLALNPDQMDSHTILSGTMAYVIADMDVKFPRD